MIKWSLDSLSLPGKLNREDSHHPRVGGIVPSLHWFSATKSHSFDSPGRTREHALDAFEFWNSPTLSDEWTARF